MCPFCTLRKFDSDVDHNIDDDDDDNDGVNNKEIAQMQTNIFDIKNAHTLFRIKRIVRYVRPFAQYTYNMVYFTVHSYLRLVVGISHMNESDLVLNTETVLVLA